ncbi:MAG TPA: hypothetical protein DD434_11075, partial [Bacteroidales bacterium]|nr:hypothetical protein [Bacteroidales bacterium]
MKLSIIIPVYNVEKYVEKCLRSCAEQDISFDEYEIIIINDGAKDNSLEIIERVAKDYNNITILSQENAGLSSARNKGLSIAKGEYVWFVDSDDWIDKNCLQNILSEVDGNDVLVMGYIEAYDDISKNNIVDYKDKNINFGKCLLLSWFFFPAQLYVFKRSFLLNNSLSFYLGIFHEDSEFTPKMLYYADKIKILTKPIYYFYKRPNSITTSVNPKKSFDYIVVASSLSIFSQDVEIKYENKFNDIISLIINSSLHNSYNMN